MAAWVYALDKDKPLTVLIEGEGKQDVYTWLFAGMPCNDWDEWPLNEYEYRGSSKRRPNHTSENAHIRRKVSAARKAWRGKRACFFVTHHPVLPETDEWHTKDEEGFPVLANSVRVVDPRTDGKFWEWWDTNPLPGTLYGYYIGGRVGTAAKAVRLWVEHMEKVLEEQGLSVCFLTQDDVHDTMRLVHERGCLKEDLPPDVTDGYRPIKLDGVCRWHSPKDHDLYMRVQRTGMYMAMRDSRKVARQSVLEVHHA